jgi:prepilin-type processing-associated H-X9-DG protein
MAREAARKSQCMNNLKQLGLALVTYEETKKEFPAGAHGCGNNTPNCNCTNGINDIDKASGFVELLPFIEYRELYENVHYETGGIWSDVDLSWLSDPKKLRIATTYVPTHKCPSSAADRTASRATDPIYAAHDRAAMTGSYALCEGSSMPTPNNPSTAINLRSSVNCKNNGLFMYKRKIKRKEIIDGTATTFAMGEVIDEDTSAGYNIWSYAYRTGSSMRNTRNALNTPQGIPSDSGSWNPSDISDCHYGPCWNGAFGGNHPGGAIFNYIDGHVAYVDENIDSFIYRARSSIAGGEIVSDTK